MYSQLFKAITMYLFLIKICIWDLLRPEDWCSQKVSLGLGLKIRLWQSSDERLRQLSFKHLFRVKSSTITVRICQLYYFIQFFNKHSNFIFLDFHCSPVSIWNIVFILADIIHGNNLIILLIYFWTVLYLQELKHCFKILTHQILSNSYFD